MHTHIHSSPLMHRCTKQAAGKIGCYLKEMGVGWRKVIIKLALISTVIHGRRYWQGAVWSTFTTATQLVRFKVGWEIKISSITHWYTTANVESSDKMLSVTLHWDKLSYIVGKIQYTAAKNERLCEISILACHSLILISRKIRIIWSIHRPDKE